jgi:hypothetical protein
MRQLGLWIDVVANSQVPVLYCRLTIALTGAGFARVRVEGVVERSRSAAEKPLHFV